MSFDEFLELHEACMLVLALQYGHKITAAPGHSVKPFNFRKMDDELINFGIEPPAQPERIRNTTEEGRMLEMLAE